MTNVLKVAFCHPDLGLGGAERLVVDAAAELSNHGHEVDIYTAYYDPARCFEETLAGSFSITIAGSWFPRHFLGRFSAICAYIRCLLISFYISWRCWRTSQQYDVIFVDQVSVVIPVLKMWTSAKVLFYCHFPDMLLAQRQSALRRVYRAPIDWLEQHTTGRADCILVNSKFTRSVFAQTFHQLHQSGIQPGVLYPAVSVPTAQQLSDATTWWHEELPPDAAAFVAEGPTFLSINRFERKKGVELAIRALYALLQNPAYGRHNCQLVIAGGYDARLQENVEHLNELQQLASDLGIKNKVYFLPSFTDKQRSALLAACLAVLYTPQNEHFGIVPLEAMAAGRPVVACNSGGPTESVVDGKTGLLREFDAKAWAQAMAQLLAPGVSTKMGEEARSYVRETFSRTAFGDKLDMLVKDLVQPNRKRKKKKQ